MAVFLPKGTRDFLPDTMSRRLEVVDRLRGVFARHGFEPLGTPAFERIETLFGKYGDEGQKLTFRILKRGEGCTLGECDLALRYDHTVPLARVMAMNPAIRLPFKRWQVAPVWRAERPARGRFREFVQCDVDIVGAEGASAEAQCLAVASDALLALGFEGFTIRLNDRRLLRAVAAAVGALEREAELLVCVDKLDKIGRGGVSEELVGRGFTEEQVAVLWSLLDVQGSNQEILTQLGERLDHAGSDEAIQRLRQVLDLAQALGVEARRLVIDPTLARGLNYYTGPVFEVTLNDAKIGSVTGGGRYDELIGIFGKKQMPAVGVSLGLERLLVVMEERGMFGPRKDGPQVLVSVCGEAQRLDSARAAQALRDAGLRVDLFDGGGKLGKQFKYADARGIRWVVVVGSREIEQGLLTLKDLQKGEQRLIDALGAAALIAEG